MGDLGKGFSRLVRSAGGAVVGAAVGLTAAFFWPAFMIVSLAGVVSENIAAHRGGNEFRHYTAERDRGKIARFAGAIALLAIPSLIAPVVALSAAGVAAVGTIRIGR